MKNHLSFKIEALPEYFKPEYASLNTTKIIAIDRTDMRYLSQVHPAKRLYDSFIQSNAAGRTRMMFSRDDGNQSVLLRVRVKHLQTVYGLKGLELLREYMEMYPEDIEHVKNVVVCHVNKMLTSVYHWQGTVLGVVWDEKAKRNAPSLIVKIATNAEDYKDVAFVRLDNEMRELGCMAIMLAVFDLLCQKNKDDNIHFFMSDTDMYLSERSAFFFGKMLGEITISNENAKVIMEFRNLPLLAGIAAVAVDNVMRTKSDGLELFGCYDVFTHVKTGKLIAKHRDLHITTYHFSRFALGEVSLTGDVLESNDFMGVLPGYCFIEGVQRYIGRLDLKLDCGDVFN